MKAFVQVAMAAAFAAGVLPAQAQYSAQLLETSKAWGSALADFNGDGHDDIFVTGHDKNDRIWYWTPAGYKPSAQILPFVDRHDCDAADVNRDGRMDLYCAIGADQGAGAGNNELWLQDETGVFQKIANHGAEDPYGRARIPRFFDFNHDGYPDIYITNEATQRVDGQPNHNRVFVNQGNGSFTEVVTAATGKKGFRCAAKGDVNQDGWDDLVVCDASGPPHVFLNNRTGDFTELVSPVTTGRWQDAKLVDMNGDGRDDLVVISGSNALKIWFNTGSGVFFGKPAYEQKIVNRAVSLTVGDFNGDGRKDVYVVLQDSNCATSRSDIAPDVVFWATAAGGWVKWKTPQAPSAGCGHLADVVDGSKVLLMNGDVALPGPNYIVKWTGKF